MDTTLAYKGYHSNEVIVGLSELDVRSYLAEPDRGARNPEGKQAEKEAVYGNRGAFGETEASGCGSMGQASEFDHTVLFQDGRPCGCGNTG